jgi:transcriptional regulator with XRE-family HTH domain
MVQGKRANLSRHRRIAQLRAKGLTAAEIAQRVGVSRQSVDYVLKGLGRGTAPCSMCRATILAPQGSRRVRGLVCLDCLTARPDIPIGRRIMSLRTIAGLTQAQLASGTGISAQTIYTLEHGKHQPQALTYLRLVTFLGRALTNSQKS